MLTAQLAALSGVEQLINQALKYDPASRQQLAHLDGKIFQLTLEQPSQQIWLRVDQDRIALLSHWDSSVDASLHGKLASFVQVAGHPDKTRALMEHSIKLSGDSQSLTRIQNLLGQLNIDWEAALADLFGDIGGHILADGLRFAGSLFSQIGTNLRRSSHNYLREESNLFAHPLAMEDFNKSLTDTRFQVDRLEARIQRLMSKLGQPS